MTETYEQYVERVGFENSISQDLWNQIQKDLEASRELVMQGGRAAFIAQNNISFLNEMLEIYMEVGS